MIIDKAKIFLAILLLGTSLSAEYIKARHLDGNIWNSMYYTDKQQFLIGMHAITDGLAWHGEKLELPYKIHEEVYFPNNAGLGYLTGKFMDMFDDFYRKEENRELEIFKVYFYLCGTITEEQLRADTEHKLSE